MNGADRPPGGERSASFTGSFKLTGFVLCTYLAVGIALSVVFTDRVALRTGFRFATTQPGVEHDRAEGAVQDLAVVRDEDRQCEIDDYLAWSRRPPTGSLVAPQNAPPEFPPRFRLAHTTYAILNPLTNQPLVASHRDWSYAVTLARRGRLDLLELSAGVPKTLTGSGIERQMDWGLQVDLGLQVVGGSVMPGTLECGRYRPPPDGLTPELLSGLETSDSACGDRWARFGDFVSRPFELTTGRPVQVSLHCRVSNAWVSVAGRLYNESTGEVQEFSLELLEVHGERPVGIEQQGGPRRVGYLPAVAAGSYTLHLAAQRSSSAPGELMMIVNEGGTYHWNGLCWMMGVVGVVGCGLGLVSPGNDDLEQAVQPPSRSGLDDGGSHVGNGGGK